MKNKKIIKLIVFIFLTVIVFISFQPPSSEAANTKLYTISPGTSAVVTSTVTSSTTVYIKGASFDYVKYNASGDVVNYGQEETTDTNSVVSGNRLIVTNTSSGNVTLEAKTRPLDMNYSSSPALTKYRLMPGESMSVHNYHDDSESIDVGGVNDYVTYTNLGLVNVFNVDDSGGRFTVNAGTGAAITNRDNVSYDVIGAYEVFGMNYRATPVSFISNLEQGQTLQMVSQASKSFNIRIKGGRYDYALYDAAGELSTYGQSTLSTRAVLASRKLIVTNLDAEVMQLKGSNDVFQVTSRTYPALHTETLTNGDNVRIRNIGEESYSLKFEGSYDYAEYDAGGKEVGYGQGVTTSSQSIAAGGYIDVSKQSSGTLKIVGPPDGFQFTANPNPALYKRTIASGQSIEISNLTTGLAGIMLNGKFDYALYDDVEGIYRYQANGTVNEYNVRAGDRLAVTNVGTVSEDIYAPYAAFNIVTRINSVSYKHTMRPGETIEVDNIALSGFKVDVSGQNHYVIYEDDGSVSEYGRPTTSDSYTVNNTETLVLTNSGVGNINVTMPHDAFFVSSRINPALNKFFLMSNESIQLVNTSPTHLNLDLSGIYDQASYKQNGELRSIDRKTQANNPLLFKGERMTITSTGGSLVQIIVPYDAIPVFNSATPALTLKTLAPGQRASFANKSSYSEYLKLTGTYDVMDFDANGVLDSYSRDNAISNFSIGAGTHAAIENSGTTVMEAYGAYEVFNVLDRSLPVTFSHTIAPGASLEVSNYASKAFYIYTGGSFDYALYDNSGGVAEVKRDYALNAKRIVNGNRIALTNASTTAITVEGPYDAFNVSNRTTPALFERTLTIGQSMEAENFGTDDGKIYMSGVYDYALYKNGSLEQYGHNQTVNSMETVEVGQRIAIQNSDEQAIVVFGAYDVFQTFSRENPVTFNKVLALGESMEIANPTARTYYLYIDGVYDFVQFNSGGKVTQMDRESGQRSKLIAPGTSMALTNTNQTTVSVKGSYDALTVSNRTNPALFVNVLQPGSWMETKNIAGYDTNIKMSGIYDVALFSAEGSLKKYGHTLLQVTTESVGSSERVAIQNSDDRAIEVYGAYDLFQPQVRANPVSFKQTLTPGSSLELRSVTSRLMYVYADGIYDYARYNEHDSVRAYNAEEISGTISVFAKDKLIVSPFQGQTIEVSGSYDGFLLTSRSVPAVTVKTLQPGQSYSFRNISPDSFYVKLNGTYDYQVFNLSGTMDSFGNNSALASRFISSTHRMVVSNSSSAPVTVTVPTDAIQEIDGSREQFVKDLNFGESVKIANQSNVSSKLHLSGTYDVAIYNSVGQPTSFAKEQVTTPLTVPAGHYAIITSQKIGGTVVSGDEVAFQVTEQTEPALRIIELGKDDTVKIHNTGTVNVNLEADGESNWVKYSSLGIALDYQLEDMATLFSLMPGQYVVVTSSKMDNLEIWGPYQVLSKQTSIHPALVKKKLDAGDTLRALNLTSTNKSIKANGSFVYRIGEGNELNGYSPITIPGGSTAYLRITGATATTFYAPYGHFQFNSGEEELKPISGSGAAQNIAKLDPTNYDPQSFHADPIDTATGAQIINRTLLTAHGSIPIPFQVQYHSLLTGDGALGADWSHNFEIKLDITDGGNRVKVYWNAFRGNTFVLESSGNYRSTESATKRDSLLHNVDGTYELVRMDGTVYHFDVTGKLTSMEGKTGQELQFAYSTIGKLSTISDPLTGATLNLTYNSEGEIVTVSDHASRQIMFSYNGSGKLSSITDANGHETTYAYDALGRIVSAASGGIQIFENEFDSQSRVVRQYDAILGSTPTEFAYEETNGLLITTITNRNGKELKRTHDSEYRLLIVTDELGRETSYTYDSEGNRTSATNEIGQTTNYTYDANGNLLSVTDYVGNTVTMTYDAANNLITTVGPDGQTVTNTYDNYNRLVSVTIPESGTTHYTYDTNGLLLSASNPNTGITTYFYTGNRLTGIENAEGETKTFGYDNVGRLTSESDAEDNTSVLIYDDNDQLTTEINPLGHTISYSYNEHGFLIGTVDARGNGASYSYDGNGNLVQATNALNEVTIFSYDGEGRVVKVIDPLGRELVYTYDDVGNVLSETNASNETVRYVYDILNRLIEVYDASNTKVFDASYDAAGNLVSMTDALNNTTMNTYDQLNRLTQEIDPMQRVTNYSYDNLSRLTVVTDPLQGEGLRTYDALNRIVGVTDPEDNATSYTYDLIGRLKSETDASGNNRTYAFNPLGQLIEEKNSRNQITNYVYDDAGQLVQFSDLEGTVTYTYDANGNIATVTDGNGNTLIRSYDELNRIEQFTDEKGNTIGYSYNAAGELTTLTYPDGKVVNYTYDAAGRMKTVTDWDNRVTIYGYNENGQLVSTHRPNGTIETRSYDAKGQMITLSDKYENGAIIYEAAYTYDAVGNVRVENVYGTQQHITTNTNQSQLILDINGPGLSPSSEISEEVDGTVMTYGEDNRLATYNGGMVSYDADGNMIFGPLQGVGQVYEYDARNRLISAGDVSYSYNSENTRTSVTANGVVTNYIVNPHSILSQVLMETNEESQAQVWYVYGLGLIGREDVNGQYLTYHYDRRGSTMALTDDSGILTDSYMYDNYGEMLEHQGTTEQPFRYNGRDGVMSDTNGLYYMRARYYNQDIKRFVNRDVLTGSIVQSQTLNRYAYVNGNPISYVDPFGLSRDGDSIWLQGGSFLVDIVPWVGTAKGFQQAFTGKNYVTGDQLSVSDRWAEGVGSTLSIIPIPGLKHVGKYGTKGAFWAVGKIDKWLDNLAPAKKLANECNCFTAGTKVLTDEGEKPIEEIEVGDKVLAKSDETGEVAYKEVIGLFEKQADEIYYIHIGDEIIEVTAEHPFWLDGKGWTEVKDLKVGDLLVSSDGSKLAIEKIEKEPREATVYNFEVEDFNSYFVSNLGIWVHNCTIATKNNYRSLYIKENPNLPSGYQVHHSLPQKYENILKGAGINIHETKYMRGIDKDTHYEITSAWSKWEKSLGRTPTAQEIQNYAKQIDNQYGEYWYK